MPVKLKSAFFCRECGFETPKWLGKCPGCGAWNTLNEETVAPTSRDRKEAGFVTLTSERPMTLAEISLAETPRRRTGIAELDRVLGDGLVPGTLTLLGGDPGIGKSTLVLQMADRLHVKGAPVLYVTGEESPEQIKLRAARLGTTEELVVVAENSLERILNHARAVKPGLLIVDSIQTVFLEGLEAAPGSVSQVRECAGRLLYFAKSGGPATVLIGHVTKEGAIAGPRVLEHMVDTVLYFEGENSGQFRILRTTKNRYGSTNEIGVFEMTASGLKEIANPSRIFLGESDAGRPGSCVTAALEGTRALVAEIQALVSRSGLALPRRTAIGLDANRLALVIAVAEKSAGLRLYDRDVYASVTGGLRIQEPSADLAVFMSLLSSTHDRPLPAGLAAVGELGLCGEIRPVAQIEKRLAEASRLGCRLIVIPAANKCGMAPPKGVTLRAVSHLKEAASVLG